MDTSDSIRNKILALHLHTSKSVQDIARDIGVPHYTVSRLLKKYHDTGSICVERSGKCGRKRATTSRDDSMILRKSKINPRLTEADINNEVCPEVSVHTVRRRLLEGGRKCQKPFKKPLLTAPMIEKRINWGKMHKQWNLEQWQKVKVFIDRLNYWLNLLLWYYFRLFSQTRVCLK